MLGARPDLRVVATDCGVYPIDAHDLGSIKFHDRTRVEALPFDTGEFDAVVSQFAFEYADRSQALRECVRVLNENGVLSFVMHARGGTLHEGCALRVAAIEVMFETPSLPDLFRKAGALSSTRSRAKMFELSIKAPLGDRLARLEVLETAAGMRASGLRSYVDAAMMMIQRPDFAAWVQSANDTLSEDLFMSRDQLRAAMSEADVSLLSTTATELGLKVGKVERRDFCTLWTASKPGVRTRARPRGR